MIWSRSRIALQACAAASALAMLYVGFFQIGWLHRLACPGFGSGCESVALARFAWPLGVADGLLGAAFCGLIAAVAQIARKQAALAAAYLAAIWLGLNVVGLVEMQKFGATCFWCLLTAALSLPLLVLALVSLREGGFAPDRTR